MDFKARRTWYTKYYVRESGRDEDDDHEEADQNWKRLPCCWLGTYLAVIVCEVLCPNDTVQISLHQLLDNWSTAMSSRKEGIVEATYSRFL